MGYTFSLVKVLQFLVSLIMKPSNWSGVAAILKVGLVVLFQGVFNWDEDWDQGLYELIQGLFATVSNVCLRSNCDAFEYARTD